MKTKGNTWTKLLGICGLALMLGGGAAPLDAGIIISNTGPVGFFAGYSGMGFSWTMTQAFTNVAISAEIFSAFSVDAYLTDSIGPGTTVADEIASASSILPSFPAYTTLFSGLSLPAGTYHVLLLDVSSTGRWVGDASPVLATDPSVTTLNAFSFTPGAYPPDYTSYQDLGTPGIHFTVTGTPAGDVIPEPSTFGLLGLGLAATAAAKWRRVGRASTR